LGLFSWDSSLNHLQKTNQSQEMKKMELPQRRMIKKIKSSMEGLKKNQEEDQTITKKTSFFLINKGRKN